MWMQKTALSDPAFEQIFKHVLYKTIDATTKVKRK